MPISVVCSGCQARFNVSEKFAGKQGPCPKCKKVITIPDAPAEEVTIHAPEAYAHGGKDSKGRPTLKPIARVKTKLSPVLIVGDYYDPATAYTGAVSTHRRMPNSWLISSDSWGHTAYGTSDCVTDQVDAYLLHGSQPSGEVCESDYVPFTDPITNPTAAAVMTQAAAFGMGPMTAR